MSDAAWLTTLRDIPVRRWQVAAAVALGTVVSLNLLGKLARRNLLVPGLTILDDLPNVGQKRKDGKRKETVVICGGRCARWLQ